MRRQFAAIFATVLVVVAGLPVGVAGHGGTADGVAQTGTNQQTVRATAALPPDEGQSAPDDPDGETAPGDPGGENASTARSPDEERRAPPETDVIGYEDGYWYDDPLRVNLTPENGFNDTEFAALKNRTKARIEYVRNREFHHEITFEFITREELLDRGLFDFALDPVRDQVWESMFVVGENRTAAEELNELYAIVVDGYSTGGKVAFVTDDPESPRIDPATLAHELDHEIDPDVYPGRRLDTWDDDLAYRSVVEGTASYAEQQYLRLCERGWSCVSRPENATVVEGFDENMGLFLWFASAYTLGSNLMGEVYERDAARAIESRFPITQPPVRIGDGLIGDLSRRAGNQALDARFGDPPYSMEQFIHPGRYPGDRPEEVSISDRSDREWEVTGQTEVGEAILYSALKANEVIGGPDPRITEGQQTGLNYSHPATTGWEGDTVRTYSNGTDGAYVFASEWENASEAREFRSAWIDLVRANNGTRVAPDTYLIDEGTFADALRIYREGSRVVVVNAPTRSDLDEVHDRDD